MGSTISGFLIQDVRRMFFESLGDSLSGKAIRLGLNQFSFNALSAYIIATASVEAFANEVLLGILPGFGAFGTDFSFLDREEFERMDLKPKLIILPQILFGRTFQRGAQPLQDMHMLIRVRNDLVHYKMGRPEPKYVPDLAQRGIALSMRGVDKPGEFLWVHAINCSEGVRWAHNTACATVHFLFNLIDPHFQELVRGLAENYAPIPEDTARRWYIEHGIDPESTNPPGQFANC